MRFPVVRDSTKLVLPYCVNLNPETTDLDLKRILVVVHGDSRNPEEYYDLTLEAASASRATDTLVLVPAFFTHDDLEERSLGEDTLYWSSQGWKEGNRSQIEPSERPFRVSSFEVLDELIRHFSRLDAFSNLQEVVVAGHSAGGQYVQRYAAIGQAESNRPSRKVRFRYVVANPSSYLYMDQARFRTSGDLIRFEPVSSQSHRGCRDYNQYKYGLDNLNIYASKIGAKVIRKQYWTRSVTYLVGVDDDDTDDESLDTSCAARLQGKHRRERAEVYEDYLGYFYGVDVYKRHRFTTVEGVGHSAREMLNSDEGRAALFGNDVTS